MSIFEDEAFSQSLGRRLMQLRQGRKMSREQLGYYIGVRGQQISKYETGENRITAERLAACAKVLRVPASYFFQEEDKASSSYDKTIMIVAAEINELPYEIRKGLYDFCKVINKAWESGEKTQEQSKVA